MQINFYYIISVEAQRAAQQRKASKGTRTSVVFIAAGIRRLTLSGIRARFYKPDVKPSLKLSLSGFP